MYTLNKIVSCLFLVIICSSFGRHPIYVSNTEIKFNKKSNRLEIAIKIFSDDLEKVISTIQSKPIEFDTKREDNNANDYIVDYIRDNLKIELNNKSTTLEFVNRRHTKEDFYAMWVLFVVKDVRRIKNFSIKNTILLNQLIGQRNYISYTNELNEFKKYTTFKDKEFIRIQ
jgi:hypothetical protein